MNPGATTRCCRSGAGPLRFGTQGGFPTGPGRRAQAPPSKHRTLRARADSRTPARGPPTSTVAAP